ncbi:MAG: hypothetical protein HKN63_00025 [Rhodobacteraceae bacterium]|nr:hypothetical protein [Paracoccaceae bacterium]
MKRQVWMILALGLGISALSGCAPLLIGGAGVVIVDEVMEQEQGGDGLI